MTPSVEAAKKLAESFQTTLDYLVDDTQKDKTTIVHVNDSLLRDATAKKAYASHA